MESRERKNIERISYLREENDALVRELRDLEREREKMMRERKDYCVDLDSR